MEFKKRHVEKSLSNQILSAFIATFISAIINFISIPLVTKFFTQSEYGTISLFISYQNILLSIAYLGMDQSMSRFFFEPLGKNSSKSLSSICLGLSFLGFIIISIFETINRKKFSYSIINEYAIWILFCSLIYILSQMILRYLNVISRLQKNAVGYAVQAVGITIVTKISYVLAALVNPTGKYGIMVLCGSSFMLALLMLCLKGKRSFGLKVDASVSVLKELFKFGLPQIPVFLLNNANNSLPQLAMNIYVSREMIGIYANAISITSILIIVQNSVNVFWVPYVYENYKTEQKNIIKVHHCVSYLMFIATLLVCIFSDVIYFLLVDKSYWESKTILPLLLISPLCYTISETLGIGFKIAKKSYWNIVVYASSFMTNLGLCYLLIPRGGILGAACSVAISAVVMLILKAIIGEKYYRCTDSSNRLIVSFLCYGLDIVPFVFFSQKNMSIILEIISIVLISILYHKEVLYLAKSAIVLLKRSNKDAI